MIEERRLAKRLVAAVALIGTKEVACGGQGEIARGDAPFATPGEPPPSLAAPPASSPPPAIAAAPLGRVRPPLDVVGTSQAIAAWPYLVPGVEARAVTSYDRSGGNDDGFGGTYSVLYEQRGEHVIFDALGPGVLRTLWFTSFVDGNGALALGKVRFYLDDDATPRFAVDANELFAGTTAPFRAPLVAGNQQSSGGYASWAPIVFRERLVVTTENRAGFYQAFYDTFPRDWDVKSSTPGPPDGALSARFGATGFSTAALQEVALDYTAAGAGTIDVVRFEPAASPSVADMRTARIRIWFDGAATPQVDVPVGAFFGSGLGETTLRAVPWTMDPGRWEARFPMPYFDGVHVTITGIAGRLFLHTTGAFGPREWIGTFTAIGAAPAPTTPGVDHDYADVTGAGKLVATVLTVDPPASSNKQWWEGDLRSFVDDLATPSIHGTGHEDDHLGGWSNEFLERPFSLPMQGCPKTEILDDPPVGQTNARATMYRVYPGIPFLRRIRHSTEHGPNNARAASYGSATFLYRQPRVRLVRSDSMPVAPLTAPVTLRLAVAPNNAGAELRRTYDAERPRQRAQVVVEGTALGAWYASDTIAGRDGTEDRLFVPPQLTKDKSSIEVVLVPEGPFDVTRVEAWSVLP